MINITRVFEYGGQEYLADITVRTDLNRTEFAVFKSKDGQFTFDDAIPLYSKRDVALSTEALTRGIAEFINIVARKTMYRNKKIEQAARAYIESIKDEPWYQVDYDDIILDAFMEGVWWFKDQLEQAWNLKQ